MIWESEGHLGHCVTQRTLQNELRAQPLGTHQREHRALEKATGGLLAACIRTPPRRPLNGHPSAERHHLGMMSLWFRGLFFSLLFLIGVYVPTLQLNSCSSNDSVE